MNIFANLNIVSPSNNYHWYTRSNGYSNSSNSASSNTINSFSNPRIGCTNNCGNYKFIIYSFYFRTDVNLGSNGNSDSVPNGKKGWISNF